MKRNFFQTSIFIIFFILLFDAKADETSLRQEEDLEDFQFSSAENLIYDPYENFNRRVYNFNDYFDRKIFENVAKSYRYAIPNSIRSSISNFLENISLPISALNSFAQGKVDNGLSTISKFLINSTIGIGGIFDVAKNKGIRYEVEDFGQTLGNYGIKSGAYLFLPFIGPSSTRDFSGWATGVAISPTGFNALKIGGSSDIIEGKYRFGLTVVSAINTREGLIDVISDLRQDSFDPYATIRSAYLQKRLAAIKN